MPRKRLSVQVDHRTLTVSNLDRVLWEQDGYTKGDLIDYLTWVAPFMLPHLKDRPLSLRRFPSGTQGKSFFQKNRLQGAPEWIEGYLHKTGSGKDIDFILAGEKAALAWLGDQACIEIHPWLSRTHLPGHPDLAVFDLDPDAPSDFKDSVDVARVLGDALKHLGLHAYPKTSGVEGLHLYVPLTPGRYTHRDAMEFCLFVARLAARAMPERVTLERRIEKRMGRVYIDCYQNGMGKTVVAPYSPRPVAGAPVSTPISWEDLDHVGPRDFNIRNIRYRLEELGDIFGQVLTSEQEIGHILDMARRKQRIGAE